MEDKILRRKNHKGGKKGFRVAEERDYNLTGRKIGHLTVLRIVPKGLEPSKNHGRYWYCQCDCGSPIVMIPTAYLGGKAGRGDYKQISCGCMKSIRHFIAAAKWDVSEDWLLQFRQDWERFSFVYKALLAASPLSDTPTPKEREELVEYFYYQPQFNKVYDFWKTQSERSKTFYDYAKPSVDHIIPKSKQGTNNKTNLQFITVFENLAKRDMTWEEWQEFKTNTKTSSMYFIENIMNGGDANDSAEVFIS